MADNMRAGLCVNILKSAVLAYSILKGAIAHSECGSQYKSTEY